MNLRRLLLLAISSTLSIVRVPAATRPVFHFVKCPGSSMTRLYGINNSNTAVGSCLLSNGEFHGFVASKGSLAYIDDPAGDGTVPEDINSAETVVGYYADLTGNFHAFAYQNGSFTDVGPPGALQSYAYGIDDMGRITGEFVDASGFDHGWIFDGNRYRIVEHGLSNTDVHDINVSGQFIVNWIDAQETIRSSLCDSSSCKGLRIPGATMSIARGIDSFGDIVFFWYDDNFFSHGAVLLASRFLKFDAPGCDNTNAWRINDRRVVVGSCMTGVDSQGYFVNF